MAAVAPGPLWFAHALGAKGIPFTKYPNVRLANQASPASPGRGKRMRRASAPYRVSPSPRSRTLLPAGDQGEGVVRQEPLERGLPITGSKALVEGDHVPYPVHEIHARLNELRVLGRRRNSERELGLLHVDGATEHDRVHPDAARVAQNS